MQQFSNYNTYFYKIAYENYAVMKQVCETLEEEGYYKEPEKLLKHTIYDSLALYVRAVLVNYCAFCNHMDETTRIFINQLLDHKEIEIDETTGFDQSILTASKRAVSVPPILLQLCGLHDYEKNEEITSLFFDRMFSILLAISSLDDHRDRQALIYMEQFYDHMINFVNIDQAKKNFPKRYLFKKMSSEGIIPYEELVVATDIPEKTVEKIQETTNTTKTDIIQEDEPDIIEEMEESKSKLDQLLEELNALTGLETVKKQITSLINVIKVRKLRESYEMPLTNLSYHMVFTGNPGTGKTTVARLLASIYKELGILKTGKFVETDRSGLVAGYVGQTAIKVSDVVKSALGGVLFIDEAYSLTNSTTANDFGSEAIDTLVKMMEDHRDNLVVIVAGYNEDMQQFLKSNTGLMSRFNTFIEFEDYTLKELIDILNSLAESSLMHLTKDAQSEVEKLLISKNAVHNKEFGNARGIRNMFEHILVNQANRLVTLESPSKEQVSTIEASDIF